MGLRRALTEFDLTNIIVGSIVGADIYIASALTAGLVGPFAIVVWVVAGICAATIAVVFAYCSYYVPRAGGPFAYVSAAFDDFYGFLTGWSLWIAELLALPVFAIAFALYLGSVVPLGPAAEVAVRGLFIGALTVANILGVRAAGRLNDLLTIIKLLPLVVFVVAGLVFAVVHPAHFLGNYRPFMPFGLEHAAYAVVLVFWAYVGFEMGTFPADEVKDPARSIPRAIVRGMAIVGIFYVMTNFVLYGLVPGGELAASTTPLVLAGTVLFGSLGAVLMTVGALFSVSGSDESGMLGSSRLAYAMAIDGLFPSIFARLHPRYGTPYVILIVEGVVAFVLSGYADLPGLISFSVFNLAFSFLLTSFALIVLKDETSPLLGQTVLPLAGIGICLFLLVSTLPADLIVGAVVLAAGVPVYLYFSPKTDIHHLKEEFLSEEALFLRRVAAKERYLANFIRLVREAWEVGRRVVHRL
ncbi:amino acid permease [Methanofollis formosanus]|uniref:Amino acid permease n=1 Tax=Methanofollis formosanus TaxID=299308 RepID=A0A8G1A3N3_9EURY|nr:amino acid permease [Methanofollis formosanus]QYZ80153.1 amino acid permease [Methanofollis formosanus]